MESKGSASTSHLIPKKVEKGMRTAFPNKKYCYSLLGFNTRAHNNMINPFLCIFPFIVQHIEPNQIYYLRAIMENREKRKREPVFAPAVPFRPAAGALLCQSESA